MLCNKALYIYMLNAIFLIEVIEIEITLKIGITLPQAGQQATRAKCKPMAEFSRRRRF